MLIMLVEKMIVMALEFRMTTELSKYLLSYTYKCLAVFSTGLFILEIGAI